MVHVSNSEGRRKMLAFSRHSDPTATHQSAPTSTNNVTNLNQYQLSILTNNIISQGSGCGNLKESSSSLVGTSSFVLENNSSNSSPTSPIPGSIVGPLPAYKSNSLNLSCIIEEEPPPGMMMSHIRDCAAGSDDNANVSINGSSASDSNLNPASSNTTTTTTTSVVVMRQENTVFTEELILSTNTNTNANGNGNGKKSRKRSVESSRSPEKKVSQSGSGSRAESSGSGEKSPSNRETGGGGGPENVNVSKSSPTNGNGNVTNANPTLIPTSAIPASTNVNESPRSSVAGTPNKESPPHSAVRHPKLGNGTKTTGLKR